MDRVEGHTSIYKDSDTGVIVNRNSSERDRYRIAKQQAMKGMDTERELDDIKSELKELKTLLHKLVK